MQELSMNILDIAENSIKAGAQLISILLEYIDDEKLILVIDDDGSGMTEEVASKVTDPFYTSRTTRKVGLGIPFIKMAAELTGGNLVINSELGKGTTVKTLFFYNSIDMMPLGNIGETIAVLLSGNPEIEFVYTIKRKDKEFVLDSREVKQLLGDDVAVSNAEVAIFIRDFTNEHSEHILL